MTLVESLAHFAEPWATAYADSKLLMNGVMFRHVGGFLLAGGLALVGGPGRLPCDRRRCRDPAASTWPNSTPCTRP